MERLITYRTVWKGMGDCDQVTGLPSLSFALGTVRMVRVATYLPGWLLLGFALGSSFFLIYTYVWEQFVFILTLVLYKI